MRPVLLYNPRLLIERLAVESMRRRRLARLRKTPASDLSLGHIDSLELLDLAKPYQISVIYDIGANVGTWSLLAKAIFPRATIHAFEPLPKHQERFLFNLSNVDHVSLHGVALGSKNDVKSLHVMEFSDASSVLPAAEAAVTHFGTREVGQIPVEINTLDEYRRVQKLPRPDLIKLDVQGYELEVLRGAAESLKNAKAVIAEVSFVAFYEGQCLFEEVVSFMKDVGFVLRAFGVNTPLGQKLYQTDVLFTADRRTELSEK